MRYCTSRNVKKTELKIGNCGRKNDYPSRPPAKKKQKQKNRGIFSGVFVAKTDTYGGYLIIAKQTTPGQTKLIQPSRGQIYVTPWGSFCTAVPAILLNGHIASGGCGDRDVQQRAERGNRLYHTIISRCTMILYVRSTCSSADVLPVDSCCFVMATRKFLRRIFLYIYM